MNDLDQRVIDFVAEYWRVRQNTISLKTRLLQDLGIDGDDACELLSEYSRQFEVNMNNFKIDEFFGPEAGFNPFVYLFTLVFQRRKLQFTPITVQDLVDKARIKKW